MAERLEVRLHGEQAGWITRGSRRDRIEFEWIDGYEPGPVTPTESFGGPPRPVAGQAEGRERASAAPGDEQVPR